MEPLFTAIGYVAAILFIYLFGVVSGAYISYRLILFAGQTAQRKEAERRAQAAKFMEGVMSKVKSGEAAQKGPAA